MVNLVGEAFEAYGVPHATNRNRPKDLEPQPAAGLEGKSAEIVADNLVEANL